ncbi:hypothetical protein JTE90_018767 [Oedothorax gibbosus]|uniref:Uncharacterized protein n=1 Tax=Oedothorax gibbosus TaxID=931172 RepID=A0AAV6UVH5_9ARAC|nr:hypothetical protein JTE90_018767 [Oedothorax gibbosus]
MNVSRLSRSSFKYVMDRNPNGALKSATKCLLGTALAGWHAKRKKMGNNSGGLASYLAEGSFLTPKRLLWSTESE